MDCCSVPARSALQPHPLSQQPPPVQACKAAGSQPSLYPKSSPMRG